ncbi:MAG: hypothetical protein ACJ798_16190 [Phenylobacterium sp.]
MRKLSRIKSMPHADWSDEELSAADKRLAFEAALRDVERLTMQMLQTALSLIGFGFTINAYFNDVASRSADAYANLMARRVGLAMLALGLLFLAMGIWTQVRYRQTIALRHGAAHQPWPLGEALQDSPAFLTAFLLLIVGLLALLSIVIRKVG